MDLLWGEFGEHFRNFDLTPLDHFLWGYVKAHVYTDKPASIDALEDNIEAYIREIPAEMLERVCQNWRKDRTLDSNKDFMHFSEFYVCFFLKNIALKQSSFIKD